MNVTTQCLRRQTLGPLAIPNCMRLVRSVSNVMLARFQEAPTTIRNIISRVERGFADFAQIPYEDSFAQRELLLLLDEFAAECDPDHPTSADPQRPSSSCRGHFAIRFMSHIQKRSRR